MATANAHIAIDGQEYHIFQMTLSQSYIGHHHFAVQVRAEKLEDEANSSIDKSIDFVGKETEISVEKRGVDDGESLLFKGIITGVSLDRTYAGDSFVLIQGYSPTYLLEDGAGAKSYEAMDLSAIANDILGQYPGNLLDPKVSPQFTGVLPYTVRYKETNFQFLSRLANQFGEWFYYNGQSVVFGKLDSPDMIDLTLGTELNQFHYGVEINPSKFTAQSYNAQQNQTISYPSSGFKPSWLDNYGQKGMKAADQLFPNEIVDPLWEAAPDDSTIKKLAEGRRGSVLSNTAYFNGVSQNPGLTIGSRISADAINRGGGMADTAFIGRFRVISVTHTLDENQNYHNEFKAVPLSVSAPPANQFVQRPWADAQIGVVTDNNDPESLGRVRVALKWQESGQTPWIHYATNHAFSDRGVYFVPEIGDEVIVGFIHGNPDQPYMIGAHYHGGAKPEHFDPDNNFKSIKTRSGHTILLDDKEGHESITILDKSGNKIFLDTKASSITITAPETMTLNCKNMNINVQEDMNVAVGANMTETIGANQKSSVGGSRSRQVGGKDSLSVGNKRTMSIGDDQITTIGGGLEVTVANGYDLTAKSATESVSKSMNVSVGSGYSLDSRKFVATSEQKMEFMSDDVSVHAQKTFSASGQKEVNMGGGKMTLKSQGKMVVKGGATTYVQGSQVKIQG